MVQKGKYFALLVIIPIITMVMVSGQSAAARSILDDDYSHAHKTTRFHWDPVCGDHVCTPQEKNKIHMISQSDNVVAPSQLGYLHTDKPYYQVPIFGEAVVKINGNIAGVEYGDVSITIVTPFNKYATLVAHTDSAGSFFVPYIVKFDAPAGSYVVTATYEDKEMTTTFLVVRL